MLLATDQRRACGIAIIISLKSSFAAVAAEFHCNNVSHIFFYAIITFQLKIKIFERMKEVEKTCNEISVQIYFCPQTS